MLKFPHDILSFEGSRDTSRASFFCGSSLGAQYKISKIKFAISMMVGSVRCIKHHYPDHRDKSERQKRGQRHKLLPVGGLCSTAAQYICDGHHSSLPRISALFSLHCPSPAVQYLQ